MSEIRVEPLDPEAFAPFGKVLGKPQAGAPAAEREDLTAWLGISDLLGMEGESTVWGYLSCHRHTLPLDQLERHCRTPEAFIPLEGSSVIVVLPPSDPNDPTASPDESAMRAFLLDGSAGVFFRAGVWHWAPFAITENATFLLLLCEDVGDDIDIRDVGPHTIRLY